MFVGEGEGKGGASASVIVVAPGKKGYLNT